MARKLYLIVLALAAAAAVAEDAEPPALEGERLAKYLELEAMAGWSAHDARVAEDLLQPLLDRLARVQMEAGAAAQRAQAAAARHERDARALRAFVEEVAGPGCYVDRSQFAGETERLEWTCPPASEPEEGAEEK